MDNSLEPDYSTEKRRIHIVLDPVIHEAGKALAKYNHRDFSAQVAALIQEEVKRSEPANRAATLGK